MRKATPAFPEEMEHWSKTSLSEPQPLGRHKRRGMNDEAGASRAGSGKGLKLQNDYPVSRKVPGDFSRGEETVSAGKLKRREREEDVAGGFNGGSVKNLKTTNAPPASRAENGSYRSSGGEEMTRFNSASGRKSTDSRRDWPSGFVNNQKTTNVPPASRAENGGSRGSGGGEMTGFSSASRHEPTNSRRDWPSGFVNNQKTTNVPPASRAENGGSRGSGGGEMTGFSNASRREPTNSRRDWPSGTGPNVDHRPRNLSAPSPPREGMTRGGFGQESIFKSGKTNTSMANKAGGTSVVKTEKPGTSSVKSERREMEKNEVAEPKPSEPRTDRKVEMENGENRTERQQKEWMKAREAVMEVLECYREHCRILEKDKRELDLKRVDLMSSKLVKRQFPHLFRTKPIPTVGAVPGIEIGDRFNYRTELRLARIHNLLQTGIDTKVDESGSRIAVSVVATDTGRYENYMSTTDTLVYSAQGSSEEDQKKKIGNKALMKSKKLKIPVRVIRTRKLNNTSVYFYDGLYTVQDMWGGRKFDGNGLKFKLVRIPGQPSSIVNRNPSS